MHVVLARRALSRVWPVLLAGLVHAPIATQDSVRRYGGASTGSDGIAPTLWVNSAPRLGNGSFALRVERSLGGTWAFPFYAPAPDDFTVGGLRFCIATQRSVYGGAYFLPGSGSGAGAGNIPLPLPNAPQLLGQPLYVQAFTLDDFAANQFGLGATTGLRVVPALAEQLVVARSATGAPDAQSVIDLVANRVVTFDSTQFTGGRDAAYARSGALAMVLDPVPARLRVFDSTVSPPVADTNVTLLAEGQAVALAVTPDASRVYVLHNSAAASAPIVAYDLRDGTSFGQPWPGAAIRLSNVADAVAMVFSGDSRVAYVSARGGRVVKVDVRPGSPTFHAELARLDFAGRQAHGLGLVADGTVLCVALTGASRGGELALIDLATFTAIDVDATAPGVQNLGGEVSRPRAPLPNTLGALAADGRGEQVYVAALAAIARVNVARHLANFGAVTIIIDNIGPTQAVGDILVSDAGDRIYATTPTQVIEIEAATGLSPRGWPFRDAVALAYR